MYNCQRPRKGKVIEFSSYVAPACLPKKSNRVTSTFRGNHCEIAGWGMQVSVGHSLNMWLHCLLLYFVYKEYNNTSSYPTSIRAAKIKVSITSPSNSNIPFNTDTDHHHSFSMLSVLFERLEQCGTASATRSMDETLQGLENSARGEKLMPVRWSQLKIIISLILFYQWSWSFELDHKSMWLGGF